MRQNSIRMIKKAREHLNWRKPTVIPNHMMIGRSLMRKEKPLRPRIQNLGQPISTSALRRVIIMNMRSKSREWPSIQRKSRMMNTSLIPPVQCKLLSQVWLQLRLYSSLLRLIEYKQRSVLLLKSMQRAILFVNS